MSDSNIEYVGFWHRAVAALVDTAIVMAITAPLLIAIYGVNYYSGEGSFFAGPADVIIGWLFPIAAVIIFWLKKKATPGKMLFNAIVVDAETGAAMTVGQSIGRYAAYFLSTIPFCLGFLWVAFDSKKQGWHDKLAGTVVIKGKRTE